MEKRLLLAVTLSIIVMLVYPIFLAKINPPPPEPQQSTQPIEKQEVIEIKTQEIPLPADVVSKTLTNDRYSVDMVNVGGSINKVKINGGERLAIDLVEDANFQAGILSIEGKGLLSGLSSEKFETNKGVNSFYLLRNNITLEKNISLLNDRYAINASIDITNYSGSTQDLSFEITTASNISNKETWESRYIEADVFYKDNTLKRIPFSNFKKYNKLYQNNIEWLALQNKYYSIIAKPEFAPQGFFIKSTNKAPIIGFIVDEKIYPQESKRYNLLFYIGPTKIEELEKVNVSFGKAPNFGIFTSISLILLSILKFFYRVFHNYGLSILLLTCCMSLILYPLTFKSLKSMKKIQELNPQIEKLRTEHKANPQRLQKETMELYRRYKVNPMSGCLPMVLQMPIFIALYQTLMRSVELKGANFLWIRDLSMPDAAFHLPFTLPFLGNAINILPILMIGAMIIQQRLSQAGTSALTDQQRMMSSVMPVVFGFIFYSLPSGLVLYWLTNTILTSLLQFLFIRKT